VSKPSRRAGIEPGEVFRFAGLMSRLAPPLQHPDELVPDGGLIPALGQFTDLRCRRSSSCAHGS
jgi:hypothetical protein